MIAKHVRILHHKKCIDDEFLHISIFYLFLFLYIQKAPVNQINFEKMLFFGVRKSIA